MKMWPFVWWGTQNGLLYYIIEGFIDWDLLTIMLLRVHRRLRVRSLARIGLLKSSTEAGGKVVGCSVSESSRHTHGTCAK